MKHYIEMWTRILDFGGKTTRAGYWVPWLVNFLVGALVGWLLPDAYGIYEIILAVAMFTLTCRRLRDAGFSWLLALLSFVTVLPLVNYIPSILCLFPSKK